MDAMRTAAKATLAVAGVRLLLRTAGNDEPETQSADEAGADDGRTVT
jgi:hypothetical protein